MKWLLVLLPLVFISCHRKEPWQHTAIRNSDLRYDMAKLSYPPTSAHKGILLEFIRQDHSIEGYLSVCTFEIPPVKDHLQLAEITFSTQEERASYVVDRLAGGQRLHLSERALNKLLELFKDSPEVTIVIGHYSQTFSSGTFERQYRKLCKLPPRLMPEKIVTFELY